MIPSAAPKKFAAGFWLLWGALFTGDVVQFLHHGRQVQQVFVEDRPFALVRGIWAGFNEEWVQFVWPWVGLVLLIGIVKSRYRSRRRMEWAWVVAAAFCALHALEHLYLLLQWVNVNVAIDNYGLRRSTASAMLPGVLGRDGWLSRHLLFSRSLGMISSSPRVVIHFTWAVGQMALVLVATVLSALTVEKLAPDGPAPIHQQAASDLLPHATQTHDETAVG